MRTLAEFGEAAYQAYLAALASADRAHRAERAAYQAYLAAHRSAVQATADANWAAVLSDLAAKAEDEEKKSQIFNDLVANEVQQKYPWRK